MTAIAIGNIQRTSSWRTWRDRLREGFCCTRVVHGLYRFQSASKTLSWNLLRLFIVYVSGSSSEYFPSWYQPRYSHFGAPVVDVTCRWSSKIMRNFAATEGMDSPKSADHANWVNLARGTLSTIEKIYSYPAKKLVPVRSKSTPNVYHGSTVHATRRAT